MRKILLTTATTVMTAFLTFSPAVYAAPLNTSQIQETVKTLTDAQRKELVDYAKSYVGKVQYDCARHGAPLEMGFNDNSGFVSQVLFDLLGKNHTTASFYTTFSPKKWDEKEIRPGDIILHYDGEIADCIGDNALIYAGVDPQTGLPTSIECTSQGIIVRSRPQSYYEQSYFISLDELE